jgi:hypothetical protein
LLPAQRRNCQKELIMYDVKDIECSYQNETTIRRSRKLSTDDQFAAAHQCFRSAGRPLGASSELLLLAPPALGMTEPLIGGNPDNLLTSVGAD